MDPEKKTVISLPIKNRNKCRDPNFLKRGAHRLSSHLKCPNTLLSNFQENFIFLLMTFKRKNLDKTNDNIVFGTLYNPLSQSSALNCANRAEGMWAQLISVSGARSISRLLPCALPGILLGDTNTNKTPLPIPEVIFQRAGEKN